MPGSSGCDTGHKALCPVSETRIITVSILCLASGQTASGAAVFVLVAKKQNAQGQENKESIKRLNDFDARLCAHDV